MAELHEQARVIKKKAPQPDNGRRPQAVKSTVKTKSGAAAPTYRGVNNLNHSTIENMCNSVHNEMVLTFIRAVYNSIKAQT